MKESEKMLDRCYYDETIPQRGDIIRIADNVQDSWFEAYNGGGIAEAMKLNDFDRKAASKYCDEHRTNETIMRERFAVEKILTDDMAGANDSSIIGMLAIRCLRTDTLLVVLPGRYIKIGVKSFFPAELFVI